MQIQKEELTEGLPELNKHHNSRPSAESGGTQPSTSNTAMVEISDCGRGKPDHPKVLHSLVVLRVTFLASSHLHLEITGEVSLPRNTRGN